jgi:hypothetical protein
VGDGEEEESPPPMRTLAYGHADSLSLVLFSMSMSFLEVWLGGLLRK